MQRFDITPRSDWQEKVEELGLIWHTADDVPYWNEFAYYSFTRDQIGEIEAATEACHQLFIEAGEYVITKGLLDRFGIPKAFHQYIADSWNAEPPCLNYGRFDFGYDGVNPPKMFEYNCDTPTSLLEASVVQWYWKDEVFPTNDQFNSIHERLVGRWKDIKPHLSSSLVHFTHFDDEAGEDTISVSYMRDLAQEAGLTTQGVLIQDIGWHNKDEVFVDTFDVQMEVIQHLYPWEWLVNEEFGLNILKSADVTTWIEPIWKMIWSNKAILPILTELFPGHDNLLQTYDSKDFFIREYGIAPYVSKAILGREGANISIHDGFNIHVSPGSYGDTRSIYQEYYKLPDFGGKHPVIGSWCIDGFAAGMGIREDGLITGNKARFVPHIIEG